MIPYTTHPEKFNWTNLKAELLCFLVNSLFLAIAIVIVIVSMLALISCSATKTIPVETIKEVTRTDTLYMNNVQYDSIYVSQVLLTDRSKDTIVIRQHDVEYRYKMLRDTIERVKIEVVHDSIPYEVRIETIKEVPRPKTWFDHLCRYTFFLMCSSLLLLAFKFIRKFRFLN